MIENHRPAPKIEHSPRQVRDRGSQCTWRPLSAEQSLRPSALIVPCGRYVVDIPRKLLGHGANVFKSTLSPERIYTSQCVRNCARRPERSVGLD